MSSQTLPAEMQRLDYDEFRRALAGLADPNRKPDGPSLYEIRDVAVKVTLALCRLFGEELDRITMWSRISSAFATAGAKVFDDDLDRWVSLLLEHVCADPGRAPADEGLCQLLETWAVRPPEWRYALLDYCKTHSFALVGHGRMAWQRHLQEKKLSKEAGHE